MNNPYREPGEIPPINYPAIKRKIHKYVSAADAKILEKLHCEWKPSIGYDKLAELLMSLEGDFAKRFAWYSFSSYWNNIYESLFFEEKIK